MGLIQNVKNWLRKGAINIGAVAQLQTILDHPDINMDPDEYKRINESLKFYKGEYGKVKEWSSMSGGPIEREMSAINMAKQVAHEYAKVIFNEQAEIVIGEIGDDGKRDTKNDTNDFVQRVLEHNDFKKKFSEYIEAGLALGGLVVRPYYDRGSGEIEFSWALANAFYPLDSNTNNISECAIPFVTTRTVGKTIYYYTLLEFHRWIAGKYVIINELYKSDSADVVGTKVEVSELYDDLQSRVTVDHVSRPIFIYLKIAGFNNINPESPLGLGVFDNAKPSLRRINRTVDQFNHEIEKGRRKTAVPETMLKGVPDGKGNIVMVADPEDDTFQIIPGTNLDDYTPKDLTMDIRTTEYIAAINKHLQLLEMETGLSVGTFTFDGQGVRSTKTATEVVSEQSQTYQSRNMHLTQVEKFIQELVIAICELGKATVKDNGEKVYTGDIPETEQIGVDFDDGVFTDKNAQKTFYTSLGDKGYVPKWYVIMKVLNLPEAKAKELCQEASRNIAELTGGITNPPLPDDEEDE